MVHIYNGVLLSHVKKWNLIIVITWNKPDRKRQILYDLYVESKKNKTEEQIKQLYRNGIIDTENKVSVRREKIGGRKEIGEGN